MMTHADTIPGRMAHIRSIFEEAQTVAGAQPDDGLLVLQLDSSNAQYRSVAYEAASMSRALDDIALSAFPQRWTAFERASEAHAVHVYIGLGWALAQRQVSLYEHIGGFGPVIQARVLDGYGYYDGMFRSRSSVRDRVVPDEISGYDLRAYDQGIGRSLWYTSKGNITALHKLVDGFSASRKGDLWRGIGIAVSFVGGCDEEMLRSFIQSVPEYKLSLASGAALLARARFHAGTMNPDAQLSCRCWCGISAEEAVTIMDRTKPIGDINPDAYINWLADIEGSLGKYANL